MKKIVVKDLKDFHEFVKNQITPLVKPKTLFLLAGDLGAGKTELVKALTSYFGMHDVQSPTFALHHTYQNKNLNIQHIDLYRLKNEDDLESTGFWDLFENESNVIFVEWANLIADTAWPWGWSLVKIEIKKTDDSEREIRIES